MRAALYRGRAVVEDGFEVATLWVGRVRAVIVCLGVGERTKGEGWKDRTSLNVVTEFPAFGALGGFGAGEHLLYFVVAGEEVDRGEAFISLRWGHCYTTYIAVFCARDSGSGLR